MNRSYHLQNQVGRFGEFLYMAVQYEGLHYVFGIGV